MCEVDIAVNIDNDTNNNNVIDLDIDIIIPTAIMTMIITITKPQMVEAFLGVCGREPGALAVHCAPGLGRTGTLIAAWLVRFRVSGGGGGLVGGCGGGGVGMAGAEATEDEGGGAGLTFQARAFFPGKGGV